MQYRLTHCNHARSVVRLSRSLLSISAPSVSLSRPLHSSFAFYVPHITSEVFIIRSPKIGARVDAGVLVNYMLGPDHPAERSIRKYCGELVPTFNTASTDLDTILIG